MAQGTQPNRRNSRRKRMEEEALQDRLQQEKEERERRQQTIIGSVAVAIVVVIALVIGGLWLHSHLQKRADSLESQKAAAYQAVQAVKEKPSSATAEGGFVFSKDGVGDSFSSVPTVEDYMDFICPACGTVNRGLDATLISLVNSGQINLEVHPEGFLDASSTDEYSTRAAAAVVYVIENDPNHALQFIAALFSQKNQPAEASGYKPVSNEQIRKIALSAGVDSTVAAACTKGTYIPWVKAMAKYTPLRKELWNHTLTSGEGMTTPTFRINKNYWRFNDYEHGSDWKGNFLTAIGLTAQQVGTSAKPTIGEKGAPIYPASRPAGTGSGSTGSGSTGSK
ncbi:DsbA family protein [Parascardovia denticolens]|uniref:DsbA family protein n=1 Tax=Parascardovia denticolens TaxID=78258 RepID=UPI0002DB9547|nr:thioredoxin domain-containing protein [Parascardovia denticolens]